jgi:hypothetical protein
MKRTDKPAACSTGSPCKTITDNKVSRYPT